MKKLILICLFSIVCLNSLFAQTNDEPKIKSRIKKIKANKISVNLYKSRVSFLRLFCYLTSQRFDLNKFPAFGEFRSK